MHDQPIYDQLCADLGITEHLDLVRPRRAAPPTAAADLLPAAPDLAAPPARHRLHEPATAVLYPDPTWRTTVTAPDEQDDLSQYDPEVETTEKTSEADERVEQPPQAADWVPPNAGSST